MPLTNPSYDIHHELIDRCRKGHPDAYRQVYRLYARSMYNVGYRIVNNTGDAEDVLQEAFVSAFRNLDHFRGDSSFGAWLKRIVINKAITLLKKRKWEHLPDDDQWDVPETEVTQAEETFPFSVQHVRQAIERLPDGYRTVLSLYLLEGYDHGEIAQVMGITESTSKSQFNRSKKKLLEILMSGAYGK